MQLKNIPATILAGWLLSDGSYLGAEPILPPEQPWNGASKALIAGAEDPWITPCETTAFQQTPRYEATIAWLQKLAEATPEVSLVSLGKSPEGRDLWMVIASAEGAKTPEALLANGKPTLLAQAGIHSGEIDGKDAGMMLLRDMTARGTKKELLQKANLLFVPIFNVDGHERFSAYGRVNQRGPAEMGWRTNARNLNLNRDYSKLDSPEMRAMVQGLTDWKPDLYLDIHVTDGMDYQYDVTWSYSRSQTYSPKISAWLESTLAPAWTRDLKAMGHIPGWYVEGLDELDITKGRASAADSPRYSTGYGDARHQPTVLIETHSLKPYQQRVLGTYVLLESTLRLLGEKGQDLRSAAEQDRALLPKSVPVRWKEKEGTPSPEEFLGVESKLTPSAVTGGLKVEWTGRPVTLLVPAAKTMEPSISVKRPKAYWIPPTYPELIERLIAHGIHIERQEQARELEVEMSRLVGPKLTPEPFEGHVMLTLETVAPEKRKERFPAGSVRVPTNQPLGDLAILLLEPQAEDSFLAWGFFMEILQQTEYIEGYVLEPMAEKMLASDPKLREEFVQKLKEDPAFQASSTARLQWFYAKTPYADERWRLYPIAREY